MNSALCALSDSGIWFKKGKEFGLHRGSRLAKATPELRPPHDFVDQLADRHGARNGPEARDLVKPFGDALRQHGFGGCLVDRRDLVGERDREAGKAGAVGPLCGLPEAGPDKRFAAMEEDLRRFHLQHGTGGLALHGQALA